MNTALGSQSQGYQLEVVLSMGLKFLILGKIVYNSAAGLGCRCASATFCEYYGEYFELRSSRRPVVMESSRVPITTR